MVYTDPELPNKVQSMNDELQAVFAVQLDFARSTKALAVETGTSIDAATMLKLDDSQAHKLTFKKMVEISRSLGFKVAAVLYHPPEASGSEVRKAWEAAGKPKDFWDVNRDA